MFLMFTCNTPNLHAKMAEKDPAS